MTTKEKLLAAINTVLPLADYARDDCIFSQAYGISPPAMVYILKRLSFDFNFLITDDFVNTLEMCTFTQLEALLEQHANTLALQPA